MAAWGDRIQWGVIDDARRRHGRERRLALVAVIVLAGVAAIALALAESGTTRYPVPAAGHATGKLQALSGADYQYSVTPTLNPGGVALDVSYQDVGAGSGACVGGCAGYVGPGTPVGEIVGVAAGRLQALVRAPVPAGYRDYVLYVAPGVAAVRVGSLGTAGAEPSAGLPTGDKLVAFRVPQSTARGNPFGAPAQTLRLLDARGNVVATVAPHAETRLSLTQLRALNRTQRQSVTTRGGRCAVTSTLDGLTDQAPLSSTSITALAPSAPGLFLSCMEDKYAYHGSKFNIAILLNAHHPGAPPTALWNSTPVPGYSGIVEVAPPRQFAPGEDTSAPLYARRVDRAWLVVQARPGFAPNPSLSQRIRVLDSIRITRLDVHP